MTLTTFVKKALWHKKFHSRMQKPQGVSDCRWRAMWLQFDATYNCCVAFGGDFIVAANETRTG